MGARFRASLIGVVATVASLAACSAALATTLAPAGDSFAGKQVGSVTFTTNNGTGVAVTCTGSSFAGKVPASSDNSLTGGAIHTVLTTTPTYTGCSVPVSGSTTTITTNSTNGAWSLDAMSFPNAASTTSDAAAGDVAAMGSPKGSAVLKSVSVLGTCIVTSPTETAPIIGAWKDGTNSTFTPSTLTVKAQINASFSSSSACASGHSPVVVMGQYAIKDTTPGHTSSAITF